MWGVENNRKAPRRMRPLVPRRLKDPILLLDSHTNYTAFLSTGTKSVAPGDAENPTLDTSSRVPEDDLLPRWFCVTFPSIHSPVGTRSVFSNLILRSGMSSIRWLQRNRKEVN